MGSINFILPVIRALLKLIMSNLGAERWSSKRLATATTNLGEQCERKLRGGYYTSPQVAEWLCRWAIRTPNDTVLEPSCGDGEFLLAAEKRLKYLGADSVDIVSKLKGVELVSAEAQLARARLRTRIAAPEAAAIVENADFFHWWSRAQTCDAIIGNPPFIRYQSFPDPHRSRAMAIMQSLGLTPNRLTNSWVPFVAASVPILRPGGRMAMVLPAEILQVSYAAQLRTYLTQHFARIDIVGCNQLFFKNAEQEVVLLLASGARANASRICRVAMTDWVSVQDLLQHEPASVVSASRPKPVKQEKEKWLKYLLSETEIEFMRALRESSIATTLSAYASVDVGVVTGRNEFFVLTREQIEGLGLDGFTLPLVSRSAQLKGTWIRAGEWRSLSSAGSRVHLLNIAAAERTLPNSVRNYIRSGEQSNFHKGFKCSIRTPWYAVPSPWRPDGFLFRQIYDFPRIVLNAAGATSTDTIHRLKCKSHTPEQVIANTYTWMSAASAEIEGRSYGGGVLELEPTEAERVLVPNELNGAMILSECDRLARAGRLDDILEENARLVLRGHMGLSKAECTILKNVWIKLRDRRRARKRQRTEGKVALHDT